MKLYLVRHGEAKESFDDSLRSLSERGKADIHKLANHLKSLQIEVKSIFHSGKKRAEETATILSSVVKSDEGTSQMNGLNPMDNTELIISWLSDYTSNLMLVGHLPFMSILTARLTGISERDDITQFPVGCVICLRKEGDDWVVEWKVHPGDLS